MEHHHAKLDRISFDPEKCESRLCIRVLLFIVSTLVGYRASGMSTEQMLTEWSDPEAEDLRLALIYAAWSATERVLEVV